MGATFPPNLGRRETLISALHRTETHSCHIMGIVNVTPDSFYEASRITSVEAAVDAGKAMWQQGATWIDIGGESTRPGADFVSIKEEINRVVPVISKLRLENADGLISIDTRRPEVARAALEAGADLVDDVSGLRDPEMIKLVLEKQCGVCIMHMQGTPKTMQKMPEYNDCARDVSEQLLETARSLIAAGHPSELIVLDPGIGFGKLLEHNIDLLQRHDLLRGIEGFSILWGVSRKSMIGQLTGEKESDDRLSGTLAVAAKAHYEGIDIVRVHDVKEHNDLFHVLNSID